MSPTVDQKKMKSSRRLQRQVENMAQRQLFSSDHHSHQYPSSDGNKRRSRVEIESFITQLFACNSSTTPGGDEELIHERNSKNPWASSHHRARSPRSVFNPILRTIECGGRGGEWDTGSTGVPSLFRCAEASSGTDFRLVSKIDSLDNRTLSDIDDEQTSLSDSDDEQMLSTPLDSFQKQQKKRRDVVKLAMYSFFSRESANISSYHPTMINKCVTFRNPLVTSILIIPRIHEDDIHLLFFTDYELEELEQDRRNTFESENIEGVIVNTSRTRKFKGINYVLQQSSNGPVTVTSEIRTFDSTMYRKYAVSFLKK